MTKKTIECNWVPSEITKDFLRNAIKTGILNGASNCRLSKGECPPTPREGEVIIFLDHVERGFSPPGSKFFRDLLNFYGLHPQDLSPNSIVNMSQFAVICEAYLQIEPTVLFFRECFYVNKQTETARGRHQELGGISFQKRRGVIFPGADLLSHPKGWGKSWIYCKAPVPDGEHPLPGFRPGRLDHTKKYPPRPTPAEQAVLKPLMDKISALAANGLEGADLIRCWLSWKIQPLSRRSKLMHEYSGLQDPQRISATDISLSSVINQMSIIVNLPNNYTGEFGLAPFTSTNPPPAVRNLQAIFYFSALAFIS